MDRKTYIIGDVHGEYDTLLKLVMTLPKNARLIFVGNLIDKGDNSSKVIQFIRNNNYECVQGNHEWMMANYGQQFLTIYPNNPQYTLDNLWINHGGLPTLKSYGLIAHNSKKNIFEIIDNHQAQEVFQDDIKWINTLPLYIEIENSQNNNIVISHASISEVWGLHKDKKRYPIFEEYALWNSALPTKESKVFNIHGHVPTKYIQTDKHSLNINTGCYLKKCGYGKLSAYCLETNAIISVERVKQ